ncbi:helix-turn-helix domain-containing protein [Serinicoccus sp. LYQ131]|uniref:helix-turn-helix domain-containing protein n=1 Tax=Serinicoccus sp. LYQ131 TaxID=3378797 RepID=UPI0038621B85
MGEHGESLGSISTLLGITTASADHEWKDLNAMSQTISPIELLTIEEAARWCHVSPNTLNYLRLQRRFAPAIRVGRRVFFKPSDLNDWLEAQREVLE